ncbi:MAG: ABC transporter ATP-binding protein [Candidatus Thorarchaeota archaeon]|nr:ABC transporter ATP-binding protein [Candidatus Thorarchaeota archaeon]
MVEPIVQVEKLIKNFGTLRALDGLSLDIGRGVFGLIGPNGAGKTTLLRILLGLIQGDGGTAEVLGLDVQNESIQIRERVGVLHERPTYPKGLTPVGFLHWVRSTYGKGSDPEEILKLVGLSSAAHRKIGNLSAGMTQRLGIAQALVSQPELVFLDEPTSNLDVVGKEEVTQLIINLHDELGVSFVVASHVLSELERICDSVAFICDGVIVEKGKTLDLIRRYTTNRYRVTTNEPRQLAPLLEKIPGVASVRVTGINSLTLSSNLEPSSKLEHEIQDAALHRGIRVLAVFKTSTLEDTYLVVMSNE